MVTPDVGDFAPNWVTNNLCHFYSCIIYFHMLIVTCVITIFWHPSWRHTCLDIVNNIFTACQDFSKARPSIVYNHHRFHFILNKHKYLRWIDKVANEKDRGVWFFFFFWIMIQGYDCVPKGRSSHIYIFIFNEYTPIHQI